MADSYAEKFSGSDVITCPVCRAKTFVKKNSIVCKNKHCFDISKQGYINLLPGKGDVGKYGKELFKSRRAVYEKGIYRKFEQALIKLALPVFEKEKPGILDCGCGEGYFLNSLCTEDAFPLNADVCGVDISRGGISLAASLNPDIKWIVADLQALPLRKNRFDLILDILTPANYSEFSRLLRKGGYVIKAVPGSAYLKELRELLGYGEYSNEKVLDYAVSAFKLQESISVSYTEKTDIQTAENIVKMTPMSFDVDLGKVDYSKLSSITIDFSLLVLKPK